jgi:hypothetical protein
LALSPELLQKAMWSLAIDKVSAEVIGVFESAEIDVLLVKGPVIAAWLYPSDVRHYGDGDLLVSPADWDRAVDVLEELGFRDFLRPLGHPRMESQAGTGFMRGAESIDLHSTLPGLHADPQEVWRSLWSTAQTQRVGGRTVQVPDRPGVLMHIALHAGHHVEGKPIEDLKRAIATATDDEWRAAATLAAELDGLEAFASGLRLAPAAAPIAGRLNLAATWSLKHELRGAQVPLAEGLNELVSAPLSAKAHLVARELFPTAAFMRWAMPLARRGRVGLVLSYPQRWLWLASRLPAAAMVLYRVRRRRPPG